MATEKTTILIEVEANEKKVENLKEQIKALKAAQKDYNKQLRDNKKAQEQLDTSAEDYEKQLASLQDEQEKYTKGLRITENQLNDLMGLSKAEIDKITPDNTDMEVYDQLITVVKEASRINLSQAHLKQRIEDLGVIAVKIAEKVPSLVALL